MNSLNDYNNFRAIATYYVKTLGLPVIPLCSADHTGMPPNHLDRCKCPGKTPLIGKWSDRRVPTLIELANWFKDYPGLNLGLILGDASELNIVGVDIDNESGEAQLQEWSQGVLPKTWEFTTGRGRRLLYRLPWGLESKKNKFATEGGELALCCSGQQTVLAPARHASGILYQWKEGYAPNQCELAEAPLWIVNKVCKLDDFVVYGDEQQALQVTSNKQQNKTATIAESDWSKHCGAGERSNHLVKLAGSLIARRTPKDGVLAMLEGWNRAFCNPPLTKQELSAMVESIWLAEESKRVKKEADKAKEQDQGTRVSKVLQPITLAKEFLESQSTLGYYWRYSQGQGRLFYCEDQSGPWKVVEELSIEHRLRIFLAEHDINWGKTTHVREVLQALKEHLSAIATNPTWPDIGNQSDMEHILLKNGLLNWKTLQLTPWLPELDCTIQLPITWDTTSKASEGYRYWIETLETWIPDRGAREYLQEYIGYCLVPRTDLRTATFLYGQGRNGKSLFLDVIAQLFTGYAHFTNIQRLSERFETSSLVNKLINVCGDVDGTYLPETAVLKSLIAGDPVISEAKYQKAYHFRPVCRLIFSANTLPKSSDKSDGWYDRWRFRRVPTSICNRSSIQK